MSTEQKVRQFILENYLFTDDQSALDDTSSFMEMGVIDSTGIMEVIDFVEQTFGFSVSDAEMVPENLDSVRNLVAFVEKKTRV